MRFIAGMARSYNYWTLSASGTGRLEELCGRLTTAGKR